MALHAVRLHPRVARQLQRQRLFLMYSFLPELCPAEAQCTHCLPATDTLLTFQHVQVTPCSQAQSCMPWSPWAGNANVWLYAAHAARPFC